MSQKKKALKITIPEPCHENINKMTPVKGGRFCGSCEKTVVDFRKMTDHQIIRFYEKNKGSLCGIFNDSQINRAIPFPTIVKPSTNWKAIAALATGLFLSSGVAAQSTLQTMGKMAPALQITLKGETVAEQPNQNTPERVVKGIIIDKQLGEPLIGANIIIHGTKIGTTTDFDGNFELKIPSDLHNFELVISYIGFIDQTISFTKNNPRQDEPLKVELETGALLGAVVVSGSPIYGGTHAIAGGISVINYEEEEAIPEIELEGEVEVEVELIIESKITVYPNPFTEKFKVTYLFEETDNYLFNLYDTKGSLVYATTKRLTKGEQIVELNPPIHQLVNGLYILQVSDSQDRILASKKVFKGQP